MANSYSLVQECDATEASYFSTAWYIKNICLIL